MIENLKQTTRIISGSKLQAFWVSAIALCLVVGVMPFDRWLPKFFDAASSVLGDLHLLQIALLVSAVGMSVYLVRMQPRAADSSYPFIFHLFVLILIVNTSCAVVQLWKYASHLIPDTWTEEVIYLFAAQSKSLADLYSLSNLSRPPFITPAYPPVYYVVLKLLLLVVGPSTLVVRFVSAGAVLSMALLLGFTLRRSSAKLGALIAPLLFLSVFPVLAWTGGSLGKPEFLAAALSLAGVVVYFNRGQGRRRQWIFWSASFCGLAILTKQSALAGVAAIALHLLWSKRYRECLAFGTLVFVWLLAVYAALWWPTEGGIWFMTVDGPSQFTPIRILQFGIAQYLTNPFVILALAASLILIARTSRGRVEREALAALYFFIAFTGFMISTGSPGSAYSYFIEAAGAGSFAIGLLVTRDIAKQNWAELRLLLLILSITMLTQLFSQFALTSKVYEDAGEQAHITQILSRLRTKPDEYIASDVFYSYDIVQTGNRPLVFETYAYSLLVDNGQMSVEPVMQIFRNKQVPYLVLSNTLDFHSSLPYGARYWPQAVLNYMKQNYTCSTLLQRKSDGRYLVICERMA